MKLVEFKLNKKKHIYVNRDLVTTITPYGEDKTLIRFTGPTSAVYVNENAEIVVTKLKDESNSEFN